MRTSAIVESGARRPRAASAMVAASLAAGPRTTTPNPIGQARNRARPSTPSRRAGPAIRDAGRAARAAADAAHGEIAVGRRPGPRRESRRRGERRPEVARERLRLGALRAVVQRHEERVPSPLERVGEALEPARDFAAGVLGHRAQQQRRARDALAFHARRSLGRGGAPRDHLEARHRALERRRRARRRGERADAHGDDEGKAH